eukprot:g3360.t1
MNESVKNALSIVTRSHLRFVSLVNCNVQCERVYSEYMNGNFDDLAQFDPVAAELSKLYYFCLGKHNLYVLARNMEARKELGGFLIKIPYHIFHFVEIMPDKDDSEVFVIHLNEKPIEYPWCPLEIYFRSPARDWLIGQIKICWKTDYMFQTLKVGVFEIKKTHEDLLDRLVYTNPSVYRINIMPLSWQPGGGVSNTGPSEFSAVPPHPSMYLYQVKDYEFFAHKDFNPASKRNEKGIFYRNKGKKKDHTKGEVFWVRASPPVDMSEIREDACVNVQALATSVLKNDIATLVRDYRLIETPTTCLKHGNPGGDIGQVFESMLYLHAPGEPYVNSPLIAKVRDERLMRKFTFNEYVMIRLLESGYLKTILNQQADTSEYPRFLVRLLQRKQGNAGGKYAASLRYAIAKQLVQLSMQFSASTLEVIKKNKVAVVRNTGTVPLADDISINVIVPTLFRMVMTSDENLQILAVVALVNYTLKNVIMKNVVMSGGIVRRVVSFLASKSSDLVRHSCALLNNCTKSEQYRQTVASFSAIPLMVNLIQPSNIPPTYPTVPILINALAVLGNLATDVSLRQKILDSCGYTNDAVGSMKETKKGQRIPTVITIFGQLLDEDADIRESTADGKGNDDAIEDESAEYGNDNDGNNNNSDEPLAMLYFHVFNLLKNLSVKIKEGDTSNKRCMRYVLADAFRIFKATQSIPLKSVILEYFYVLSFDQSVLHDMYSNHSLRLMLDKMAETSVEGLEGIVKDLRRLHEALLNN